MWLQEKPILHRGRMIYNYEYTDVKKFRFLNVCIKK